MATIAEQWLEEGREEGREEGMEEGMEKGKWLVVENCLNEGYPVQTIAKITGFSVEQIQKFKADREGIAA